MNPPDHTPEGMGADPPSADPYSLVAAVLELEAARRAGGPAAAGELAPLAPAGDASDPEAS